MEYSDNQPVVPAEQGPVAVRSPFNTLNNDLAYKTIIDVSGIGVWEYFSESNFLRCNGLYFSMLGRDRGQFDLSGQANLKSILIDLLHPDDVQNAMGRFREFLKKPEGLYEDYFRMQHADGSWIWIWSRGGLLQQAASNQPPVIMGTHIDITRHRHAEDVIQRERILLRTLIDNLPDTIYVKDIEGRKIIANRADVACIGVDSEAAVLGKTDLDLFNNDIGRRGYEDDMLALSTGNPIINREEYFLDASGAKRWLLTSKIPVRNENGQIIRLLGIGHDITLRKESEEVLNSLNQELYKQSQELSKQAADLKALNVQLEAQKEQELEKAIAQGKFEIASEVLHDIGNAMVGFGSHLNYISRAVERNNLENIRNLALFLKAQQKIISEAIGSAKAGALVTLTEGIAKTQAQDQEEMRGSVNELLNIITHIQEILNIQRQLVKGHAVKHERKPVNLINIIDDCRAMLITSFDKKGIDFKVNIRPASYIIKGDHTKLMQVLLNILKNSVEAIDADAPEKNITVDMQITGHTIELTIADNGQGFDEETGRRFFERGFTTKKSGTGLGLYNCRSIVESHSGTYQIQSHGPGMGSVSIVRFSMPA